MKPVDPAPGGVVVLISGRGSNMRALVEAGLPVTAVLSNRPDAPGLAYARERGIPALIVDHKAYATREDFDRALMPQSSRLRRGWWRSPVSCAC